MNLQDKQRERLAAEFYVDDHGYWELPDEEPKLSVVRQNQWDNNREGSYGTGIGGIGDA